MFSQPAHCLLQAFNRTIPEGFRFFEKLANKEGGCATNDVEDEENEIFFDEGECPQVVQQSTIECGLDKFKGKLANYKNQLKNANDTTACKVCVKVSNQNKKFQSRDWRVVGKGKNVRLKSTVILRI